MAAGNLNLIVRGFWLDGSHLQFRHDRLLFSIAVASVE